VTAVKARPGRVIQQIPAPAQSADNPPVACLQSAGFDRYVVGPVHGIWRGSIDPTYPELQTLYIDGPYASKAAADESAATLKPIDKAERGGLYVVSALLRSTGTNVHLVAACLDAGGPASPSSMKAKQPKQKPGQSSLKF
jgi:hypothetical protein